MGLYLPVSNPQEPIDGDFEGSDGSMPARRTPTAPSSNRQVVSAIVRQLSKIVDSIQET